MKAQRYRISVVGFVDESWAEYFGGMTITAEPRGVTRLAGEVADQAALHGLLNRVRDLNLRLVSVQLLESDGATPVECRHCRLSRPAAGQDESADASFGR